MQGVIGLENALATVDAMLAANWPAHALLFYGTEGVGKTLLAEIVAKAWLCPQPVDGRACGHCGSCQAFDKGRAVDFELIEPQGDSRNIRIGMITETEGEEWPGIPILTFFRTRPLMSRHKVVLVQDADRMNLTASNALLKTLEEPGEHARMILTTTAIGRILPTIHSRCLTIACAGPEEAELRASLGEIEEYERVLSEGSPGMILRIRAAAAPYRALWSEFERLPSTPLGGALLAAERFREAAAELGEKARIGNTEALRCLALWVADKMPERPDRLQAVVETHRRILGNANAPVAFDPLFASLLS